MCVCAALVQIEEEEENIMNRPDEQMINGCIVHSPQKHKHNTQTHTHTLWDALFSFEAPTHNRSLLALSRRTHTHTV